VKQTPNGSSHALERSSLEGGFRGSTGPQRTGIRKEYKTFNLDSAQIPERIGGSHKVVIVRTSGVPWG
jgi:hypothetical protein